MSKTKPDDILGRIIGSNLSDDEIAKALLRQPLAKLDQTMRGLIDGVRADLDFVRKGVVELDRKIDGLSDQLEDKTRKIIGGPGEIPGRWSSAITIVDAVIPRTLQ